MLTNDQANMSAPAPTENSALAMAPNNLPQTALALMITLPPHFQEGEIQIMGLVYLGRIPA